MTEWECDNRRISTGKTERANVSRSLLAEHPVTLGVYPDVRAKKRARLIVSRGVQRITP